MDFQNLTTAISSVGFPIIMCLLLGWYITKRTDTCIEKLDEILAQLEANDHGSNDG